VFTLLWLYISVVMLMTLLWTYKLNISGEVVDIALVIIFVATMLTLVSL
jgi:hypothetical protein